MRMRKTEGFIKAAAPASNERGREYRWLRSAISTRLPQLLFLATVLLTATILFSWECHSTYGRTVDSGISFSFKLSIHLWRQKSSVGMAGSASRTDDDDDSRLMLFLPTERTSSDRFFLSRIISRRRRSHRQRPTCHYPGQAKTIGGISGDLLSRPSKAEPSKRTMDNRDIYTDL